MRNTADETGDKAIAVEIVLDFHKAVKVRDIAVNPFTTLMEERDRCYSYVLVTTLSLSGHKILVDQCQLFHGYKRCSYSYRLFIY
jgi:hypothetical protein